MKGGPGAWVRGAAERRSLQWPWVSVGEFPLRPPPINVQPSIVPYEWMSGSGGPTYSRTGLGVKLDFGIAGVLAWCGESSNDASPTSVPTALGASPPLPFAPLERGGWEGGGSLWIGW